MTQAPGERPPGQGFEAIQSPQAGQAGPSSSSAQSHIRLPGSGEAIPAENLTFVNKAKPQSSDEAVAQKINDSLRGSDDGHSTVQQVLKVEIPAVADTFHTLQERPLGLGERVVQPGQADDRMTDLAQIVSDLSGSSSIAAKEQIQSNILPIQFVPDAEEGDSASLLQNIFGKAAEASNMDELEEPLTYVAASLPLSSIEETEAAKLNLIDNVRSFSLLYQKSNGEIGLIENKPENLPMAIGFLPQADLNDKGMVRPIIHDKISSSQLQAINTFVAGVYHDRGVSLPPGGFSPIVLSGSSWKDLIAKVTIALHAHEGVKINKEKTVEKHSSSVERDVVSQLGWSGEKTKERRSEEKKNQENRDRDDISKMDKKRQEIKSEERKFESERRSKEKKIENEKHDENVELRERSRDDTKSEIRRKS